MRQCLLQHPLQHFLKQQWYLVTMQELLHHT